MVKEVTTKRFACSVCSKDYAHKEFAQDCEQAHKNQQEEDERVSKCHENHGATAITRTDVKCVSCKKTFVYEEEDRYAPCPLGEDTLYKCTHCGHEAYIDEWEID